MTQRIFDMDNAEDMALLWSILPEEVFKIKKEEHNCFNALMYFLDGHSIRPYLILDWHDKTEITRPIQEATEQDAGKLCYFWDDDGTIAYGLLSEIIIKDRKSLKYGCCEGRRWTHARRLTKQEIEELC